MKKRTMPPGWKYCHKLKYYNGKKMVRHGWYSPWRGAKGCPECAEIAERKKAGKCCAVLGHGPGHQSKTFCEETGPHKIHRCTFGSFDQVATWVGQENRIKFTGYFDEAPNFED